MRYSSHSSVCRLVQIDIRSLAGPLQKRCHDCVINALAAASVIVRVEHATNSSSLIFIEVIFRQDIFNALRNLVPVPRLRSGSYVLIVIV